MSEHQHHHRRSRASKWRRFLRTYWFEIIWLIIVALGIFLVFERLNIRRSLTAWFGRGAATTLHGVGHLGEAVAAFLARTTVSDAFGFALILGALLAIALRVRWRLVRNPAYTTVRCPKCDGTIRMVHRHTVDRLINLYVPVRRYRCANAECRWYGLRIGTGRGSGRASISGRL